MRAKHLLVWSALMLAAGATGMATVGCGSEVVLKQRVKPPPAPPAFKAVDADNDGIADNCDPAVKDCVPDACPDKPGVSWKADKAKHGCPLSDKDGDKIFDECSPEDAACKPDKCPDEPGEPDLQNPEKHGCKHLAVKTKEGVKITEQIKFDLGKADIKPESIPVLEAVAGVLIDNPDIQLIEVAGHASREKPKAPEAPDIQLSQRRVEAVVAKLVELGVQKERLSPTGYGFLCPASSDPADKENRRVEFRILVKEGKLDKSVEHGCQSATQHKPSITAKSPDDATLSSKFAYDADKAKAAAQEFAAKAKADREAKAAGKKPEAKGAKAPKAAGAAKAPKAGAKKK